MRVVAFAVADGPHLGTVVGEEIADVTAAAPGLPRDLPSLLAGAGLDALRHVDGPRRPLAGVALLAPVARPPKLLAIGLNYRDHVAETGREPPSHQLWFNKQSTCVVGPGSPIEVPRASEQVDYEGELGIVIGRRCRHVPAGRAREVVAGWLVVNDVSVRDWQYRSPTFTMGKSWDTHGPIGPWMVTDDEVDDPHDLRIRTTVNGELRQDGRTADMVFDCWEMIEHLSTAFTLEPGDIISTGTPAGVGMARHPPAWLRAGDTVRIEIDAIGALENPVIDEPDLSPVGLA
jgi:2-keto-4-pentenoate hydratase/2-oxohepta-3-ene-1,7-dioic acid hydratase in catechol pathway